MITKKELGYVTSWATKVPYPGMDYATKTMELLNTAFENYNKYYNDKTYDIILSNAEQLEFEILSKNLCHMLGVDYKNLSCDYFRSFREDVLGVYSNIRSYDLLKSIIDHINDVLKYDYDNGGKALNYYRIMIKCAIFDKLSDFSRFNFGVINFNKDLYEEKASSKYNGNTEKFLYIQSNEAASPYFMMGILREDINLPEEEKTEESKYIVETLMAPTNIDIFFDGQEVVIPTQILVTTPDKMEKMEATPEEKIALLNQYRSIIHEYNIPNKLNIYGDYESMLTENSKKRARVR